MSAGRWLALTAVVVLTLWAVWSPVGLAASPFTEAWSFHVVLDHGQAWIGAPYPHMRSRPLLLLPYGLAHRAARDSFAGLQVGMLLSLAAKALLVAAVLRRLGSRPAVAAASGLLAMIFPGDRGMLQGRYLVAHVSIDLMLAAILVWLVHLARPRWVWPVAFWSLALASLLMYENALPLAFAVPWLALASTHSRPRRRWLIAAGLWYAALAGFLIWAALSADLGASYQTAHLGAEPLGERLRQAASATGRALWVLLAGAWVDGARRVLAAPAADLVWAAFAGLAAGAVVGPWSRVDGDGEGRAAGSPAALMVLGAAVLLAGYLPFALSAGYRDTDVRVLLGAALGAAPLVAGAAAAASRGLGRYGRRAFAGIVGVLVAVAALAALGQQHWILDLSRLEQQVLSDIVGAAPAPPVGAVLLLEDPHGLLARDAELFGWRVTDGHFSDALRLLYERLDLRPLGWRATTRQRWAGAATPRADGLAITLGDRQIDSVGYERVAFFVLGEDGRARLSARLPAGFSAEASALYAAPRWPQGPTPRRAAGFLPLARPGSAGEPNRSAGP